MSLYRGFFADKNNVRYRVDIQVGTNTTVTNIDLAYDQPCVITTESDGLFSPIKSRGCTINIVTKSTHYDMWTPLSHGVSVKVYNDITNTVVFSGWMTPNQYSQNYSYQDNISLEAVDCLSTLENFNYTVENPAVGAEYSTLKSYLLRALYLAGYRGNLIVTDNIMKVNGVNYTTSTALDNILISESNFFDDDDEHTPSKWKDVLIEICKYFGVTMVPYGDNVYVVDYDTIKSLSTVSGWSIPINGNAAATATIIDSKITYEVTADRYSSGTPSMSLDDVYNKITVNANTYTIDDLTTEFDNHSLHKSVTEEARLAANGTSWSKTTATTKWYTFWKTDYDTKLIGDEYQTWCRMVPKSGWKHHWYSHTTGSEITDGPVSSITKEKMNYNNKSASTEYKCAAYDGLDGINTLGCLIQNYSFIENAKITPTSADFDSYLTFFVANSDSQTAKLKDINTTIRKPVLEYVSGEAINFSPNTGKSWINIKGDLYYQRTRTQDDTTMDIINTKDKFYACSPAEKHTDFNPYNPWATQVQANGSGQFWRIPGIGYVKIEPSHGQYPQLRRVSDSKQEIQYGGKYGEGFELWSMKLQIGDKYWDGSEWTTTESIFKIKYNNSPGNDDDEVLNDLTWISPVTNTVYSDGIDESGYNIPITKEDALRGEIRLTIYQPDIIPQQFIDELPTKLQEADANPWLTNCPCIFAKDFSLNYIYTSSKPWYLKEQETDSDIIYTNVIDDAYVNEFSDLDVKVNTWFADKPISRSYPIMSNGGYLLSVKNNHQSDEKVPENNLIERYYKHYSAKDSEGNSISPKAIFNANIRDYLNPMSLVKVTSFDRSGYIFAVDSQEWDIAGNENSVKLIEI